MSSSGSKFTSAETKTPKTRVNNNLHNAWVDYINKKNVTPEEDGNE